MNNMYKLEPSGIYTYIELLIFFPLVAFLLVFFGRGLRVFKRTVPPKSATSETQRDMRTVTRYARLQVVLRGALLLGATGLFIICCCNAYGWFNSVNISEEGFSLIRWGQLHRVDVLRRGAGGVLRLSVDGNVQFQSVRALDLGVLRQLQKELVSRRPASSATP